VTQSFVAWEDAIDQLYDAVGREDRLADALGVFRGFFNARGVMFLTIPDRRVERTAHIGAIGIDPAALIEYHSHFSIYDVWANGLACRTDVRFGSTYRGSDLAPRRELVGGYFWREFLTRNGVIDLLTCVVEPPGDQGPTTVLTFHRHVGQPIFERAQVPRLASLAPHLRRVLRLHRRLAPKLAVGSTLQDVFHTLNTPMLFVARDGRLVDRNAAADAAFGTADPLLRLRNDRIGYADGDGWHELAPALAAFAKTTQPALSIELKGRGGARGVLDLRRVHGATTDRLVEHPSMAICTLRRPAGAPAEVLAHRFGFTAVETRVAQLLAGGQAPARIADELGVRISTIRTHLRSLLTKTGTSRQAQLVSLMLAQSVR